MLRTTTDKWGTIVPPESVFLRIVFVFVCLFVCLIDMTFAVDSWALNNNYLSIYLGCLHVVCLTDFGCFCYLAKGEQRYSNKMHNRPNASVRARDHVPHSCESTTRPECLFLLRFGSFLGLFLCYAAKGVQLYLQQNVQK